MIKDGREYLVLCVLNSQVIKQPPKWDIVRWGTPVGMSDPYQRDGWINSIGFSYREDNISFAEAYELSEVLKSIRGEMVSHPPEANLPSSILG